MKKHLKLKKRFKIALIIIIIVTIGSIYGINKYKEYKYHQTYEYKLIEHGYSLDESKLLINNLENSKLDELLEESKNENIIKLLNSKYFIKENLERYTAYLKTNVKTSIDNAITIVNVNRDYKYYEQITETDLKKDYLILVNKYYNLNSDFAPSDLVTISPNYSWGNLGSKQIRKIAYDAYLEMWEAANKEASIWLMVNSAYRNYATQEELYNNFVTKKNEKYADSIAARPGHSEHETGLALDIFTKISTNKNTFKDSEAYTWLKNNSYKYGFILRYPENKETITGYDFESWHYRFVGKDVAKYIFENDITFDEYYAYFLAK